MCTGRTRFSDCYNCQTTVRTAWKCKNKTPLIWISYHVVEIHSNRNWYSAFEQAVVEHVVSQYVHRRDSSMNAESNHIKTQGATSAKSNRMRTLGSVRMRNMRIVNGRHNKNKVCKGYKKTTGRGMNERLHKWSSTGSPPTPGVWRHWGIGISKFRSNSDHHVMKNWSTVGSPPNFDCLKPNVSKTIPKRWSP